MSASATPAGNTTPAVFHGAYSERELVDLMVGDLASKQGVQPNTVTRIHVEFVRPHGETSAVQVAKVTLEVAGE